MGAAIDSPPHQSGFLQRLDVLGSAGEGHVEGGGELADAAFALSQALENGPAGRIRQGMEYGVQFRGLLLNHMV
jgi:hypothetical protein